MRKASEIDIINIWRAAKTLQGKNLSEELIVEVQHLGWVERDWM